MLTKHEFVKSAVRLECAECGLIEAHVVHHAARSSAKRGPETLRFHTPDHGKIVEMATLKPYITRAQVAAALRTTEDQAETQLRAVTARGWLHMFRASNDDGSFLEFRWETETMRGVQR